MSDKFRDKYRVHTTRVNWWDYSRDGVYFITICTQNREHYFGEITNAEMNLSPLGKIAEACWLEIPNHFPYTHTDAFVAMPNHIHGILVIDKTNHHDSANVETQDFASPTIIQHKNPKTTPNKFGPQSKNLASIIRGYKVGVTKNARLINPDFCWQPRFHDHIIKTTETYQLISDYIQNNPKNWEKDTFFQ